MGKILIEYVRYEDLRIINQALSQGEDVRIQATPGNGCRIISDRVRVLKRRLSVEKEKKEKDDQTLYEKQRPIWDSTETKDQPTRQEEQVHE